MATPTDLLISEYVEGSSFNKAVELFNGTGSPIDLSQYYLVLYSNGSSSPSQTVQLSGTLASGGTYVVAHGSAGEDVSAERDLQSDAVANFNGDDAIVLRKGSATGTVIDSIGQIGVDPGAEWGSGTTSTADNTLRLNSSITEGDTDPGSAYDPSVRYEGFAQDTFDGLGSHAIDDQEPEEPQPGITISQTGGLTQVTEEGATDTFTIVLDSQPTANVTITIEADDETNLSTETLVFTPENYDVPQEVTVTAAIDTVNESPDVHQSTISFTAASSDAAYNALQIDSLAADVRDEQTDVTLISAVQGAEAESSFDGQLVTVEAIVVGDFQGGDEAATIDADGNAHEPRDLDGFYIQEETIDSDGNVLSSEAIFVYDPEGLIEVQLGDRVRVTGRVDEYFGETQLVVASSDAGTGVTMLEAGAIADVNSMAAEISLPSAGTTSSQNGDVQPDLEAYEGMLVTIPDELTVVEQFQLDRFNEIKLFDTNGFEQMGDDGVVTGERPFQYTQYNDPDVDGNQAYLEELGSRTITYDDGLNVQNADISNLDGFQGYSTETAPRMGDTVTGLTGVLDYKWAGNSSSGATWRVRSIEEGANTFDDSGNPRPAASVDVEGDIKVASFNVLNFFTTIATDGAETEIGEEPRGATNATEFVRQIDKLVDAIIGLDADILGLLEIENDFNDEGEPAIQTLVNALNAEIGSEVYAYVDPGQDYVGGDAIAVAMIYRKDVVNIAEGTSPAFLTDADVDPALLAQSSIGAIYSGENTSRSPLAATFQEIGTDEELTVVVNHLKSKGGNGTGEDADAGDGAGAFNNQRLLAAQALDAWLETNPTGSETNNTLLIGDFNSYAEEDPIDFLTEMAGYVDVAAAFLDMAYSYLFDGTLGTLDYAFASLELFDQVVDALEWHINADEADALDYNTDFGRDQFHFDGDTPYRSSDHDPILVGLDLDSTAPSLVAAAPADDSTSIAPDTDIILTFDEDVQAGTGNITISNGAGDVLTIDVTSDAVTIDGDTVIINPETDLEPGTTYDVTMAEGVIEDTTGNAFAGLVEDELDFTVSGETAGNFTLQILHASDFEAGLGAVDRAGNFAAIVDYLEETHENSITLSSGDNFLPSPFFNAGSDPSLKEVYETALEDHYDLAPGTLNISPAVGVADISMLNIIGVEASAIGNHEFDAGTNPLAAIVRQTATYPGAQFPYLSANLDFSGDPNLNPLYTSEIRDAEDFAGFPPEAGIGKKIAPATIINENGERIGVVGATTQIVESISSTGGVEVIGDDLDDMEALAAILQPTIDALRDQGINKIVLTSHLQQIALEQELATHLHGVDIIIAGGSHTLLADEEDVDRGLQAGDTPVATYPLTVTDADNKTTLIVNTDSEYSYVGRLVVEFDENGDIIADSVDPDVSGAYATTDEVVGELYEGNTTVDVDDDGDIDADDADPFAEGGRGDLVNDIAQGVGDVIEAQDGNILGRTDVYLEGRREEVRQQETNLGNLSADANLWYAQLVDDEVLVSIKNGGGIRDSIGRIDATGGTAQELPPAGNPDAGKEEGDISQLDIANSLRFNNALSLVTVTSAQLLQVLEHAVAASTATGTPGQFAQIGGIAYSFDIDRAVGDRVVSAALLDENGEPTMTLVENGELAVDPAMAIRVVTLSFLLTGGDGYPFNTFIAGDPAFANVVSLTSADIPDETQVADFAAEGTEQDAFAEYVAEFFSETPYAEQDTDRTQDERIQNLDFRDDTVLEGTEDQVFAGGPEDDAFIGGLGNDTFIGGDGSDDLTGNGGDDIFILGADIDDAGPAGPRQIELGDGTLRDLSLSGLAGTADTVDGGLGTDTVVLDREESDGYVYDVRSAPQNISGIERVLGTDGNDIILFPKAYTTDGGMLTVLGMEGDDAIGGTNLSEYLDGGADNDLVSALGGNDAVLGGEGDDELWGGDGSDSYTFAAGDGVDEIIEGPGSSGDIDRVLLEGLSFDDALFFKKGSDVEIVFGEDGVDGRILLRDQLLNDGSGVEEIVAGENTLTRDQIGQILENRDPVADDETLDAIDEDAAAFTIPFEQLLDGDTDEDLDTLFVSGVTAVQGGTVELVEDGVRFTPEADFNGMASFTYEVSDGRGGTDTGTASFQVNAMAEDVIGTEGRNFLFGTEGGEQVDALGGNDKVLALGGDDTVNGGSGSDILLGGEGDDILSGDIGLDTLFGGSGNDRLDGGAGIDLLFGEGGNDTFVFRPGAGRDSLFGFQGGAGAGDVIELDLGEFTSFEDLQENGLSNSFLGAQIRYDDGSVLTLFGVQQGSLSADDFAFV